MSLVESVQFNSIFSFKYSPRPNTLAEKRLPDDVPEEEKTRRIVALQARQRQIHTALNEAIVGTDVSVLVDAASRRRDTEVSGRTTQNVVVNFPGATPCIGHLVTVHVERAGAHSVWGRAVSANTLTPVRAGDAGERHAD